MNNSYLPPPPSYSEACLLANYGTTNNTAKDNVITKEPPNMNKY